MLGTADHCAVLVDDDEIGMGELEPTVEPGHLARKDPLAPGTSCFCQ